jgi:hypothetical protein
VHTLVRDPLGRIDAMLRLSLIVGISAVVCGYLFLRNVGIGVPAAALACGALVWSASWWVIATGELSWLSWLQLFQLGGVAGLGWALAHWENRRRRIGLLLTLACALAAALSAFDAWPWFPTLFGILVLLAVRKRRSFLLPLVLATGIAAVVSLGGAATRVAINWWHFGSMERVVRDVQEAYAARSTLSHLELEIMENRANFVEPPRPASHWDWIGRFGRNLPRRLLAMFLPDALAARWAWGFVAVLAIPEWLLGRRREPDGVRERWPSQLGWLVALALAGLPFVLICPAIAVLQYCALLAFTPALLLAGAWICEGVFASLTPLALGRLGGATLRRVLTLAIVGAVVASPVVRRPEPAPTWPAPPIRCETAVRVLSQLKGVVFVDDDVNPLVFLAPLDASVAFKPIWAQKRYLSDVRPLHVLRIAGRGKLPERELAKLHRIDVAGLPEGFELLAPGPP